MFLFDRKFNLVDMLGVTISTTLVANKQIPMAILVFVVAMAFSPG